MVAIVTFQDGTLAHQNTSVLVQICLLDPGQHADCRLAEARKMADKT
jgi:hypothetical protein